MVERTSECFRTAATTSIDTAIAIAAPTCSGSSIPLPRSWNCTEVTCTITRPRLQSRSILVTRCTGWAPWTTVPIPRFNRYVRYSYRGNRRAITCVHLCPLRLWISCKYNWTCRRLYYKDWRLHVSTKFGYVQSDVLQFNPVHARNTSLVEYRLHFTIYCIE